MKKVVSVSLGSSHRDHEAVVSFLGQKVHIQRIGTDGDVAKASDLFRSLDGRVDALGVGGIDLALHVKGRAYPLRRALKLVADIRHTPFVDGAGLKSTLERRVMQVTEAKIGNVIPTRRALITSALDRFSMAESFVEAGYSLLFGDFMWALGIPIPLHRLRTLEFVGAVLLPVLGGLPLHVIYPTGKKQDEIVPKWEKCYNWASIIAGDFNYIKRHIPPKLENKVVVTNTTTAADVDMLRDRGVSWLVTTTPRIEGRSFGTNVIEAMLIALAGKGRRLTLQELEAMLVELEIQPAIISLQDTSDSSLQG